MRPLVLALAAALIPALTLAQTTTQPPPQRPKQALTPQQEAYRKAIVDFAEQSDKLQATAKIAYSAETKRGTANICPNANNTVAINECILHEMALTSANYKAYAEAIRALLALPTPDIPDMPNPYQGPTGQMSTSATETAAFDKAEAAWQNYVSAECGAVDTHWRGGTIVNFEIGECHIRLARDRMNELESVYGKDHL
ncbi:MAG TPA: lysozyme inhibitor LprI family protein [Acidobacteriaceae bacterium]|nr:lysozyme inhibitor LprI family protein [Acidobacteriaceae bacterium]